MVGYQGKPAIQTAYVDITERKLAEQALRKAELRYRTIADFTYDWEDWENPDGTFRYVSPACERITGYVARRFMDDPGLLSQLILPEDREIWAGYRRDVAETPGLHEVQFRIRRHDGEIRWIEHVCQPVTDPQGAFLGYRGSNRDVTERKKAEEAIRQSERRFRAVVENSPDFIVLVKRDGIIFDLNRLIKGYTREMVVGQSVFNEDWYETKDQALSARKQIEHVFRTGESGGYEYAQTAPDGSLSFYETRVAPFEQDAEGSILSVQCVTRDITERKQAEQALQGSKELFEKTFNSQRNAIFLLDVENPPTIIDCNPATIDVFGYSRQEMLGRTTVFLHVNEATLRKFQKRLYSAMEERGFLHLPDFKMKRKDGTIFPTEHSVVPLEDERGKRSGWVSVVQDITERKQVEEELLKYQSKLKAMASQLSSIQERQRRQLALELHDRITQNLAMAKLGLETVAHSFTNADAAGKVRDIAEQIGGTMEDAYSLMLELSNPVLYEIGLKPAVDTLIQSDLVKNSGITCKLVAPKDSMKIDLDVRVALYQAARELLVNAIKYSKAKEIKIRLRRTSDAASVTVKDDGVGFDPSAVKQPGKQGGFGLFNMRENIGALGGEFTIESKLGEGTSAEVWVPLPRKDSLIQKGDSYENTDRR